MKAVRLPVVNIFTEVRVEDLITQLFENLTREEYIQLIKQMELRCADLEMTYELRDYFDAEIKKEEAALSRASKSPQNA